MDSVHHYCDRIMEMQNDSMLMNRSRSIPRRTQRQSWPSLEANINEQAAIMKIQASMDEIVKREMSQMGIAMSKMNADHVEMQTQAAGIVRDVKNALQTLAVQQQMLAATINKESQRIHQVENDQSNIVEGMHLLDHQQVNQSHRLDNHQAAVQSLGQEQVHLNAEVRQTAEGQDTLRANIRDEMIRARNILQELQTKYDEINADPSSSSTETRRAAVTVPEPQANSQFCSPITSRTRLSSTAVHTSIRKPPKFDIERFVSYKDELELWRDSHALIDDPLLIAEITLRAENPLRMVLLQFMKSTKEDKESRTFKALFKILDTEFQRDSHERALMKMQQFQSFRRVPGEDIFTFWIRFNKITADIVATGLDLKAELIFLRALQALELPSNDRLAILSSMNLQANSNCPKTLRIVTQRLLARPIKSEDVLLENHTEEKEFWELAADVEGSFIAKNKVNRPGYEAAAIKGAQRQMNYPNTDKNGKKPGKGMLCYRCGSKEHLARDCHLPWTKAPAFNLTKGNSNGKKGGWNSKPSGKVAYHLSEEGTEDPSTDTHWNSESGQNYSAMVDSGRNETEMTAEASAQGEEDAFMAQWWEEDIVMMMADQETCSSSLPPLPMALIDSGASSSVAGMTWIRAWSKLKDESWISSINASMKSFRFGDGSLYPSKGTIVINAMVESIQKKWVPINLNIDIVECNIPLLISRRALVAMSAVLDFVKNRLSFGNDMNSAVVPTIITASGHVSLDLIPTPKPISKTSILPIFQSNEELILPIQPGEQEIKPLTIDEITRIHVQLGHASFSCLKRLFSVGKRKASEQEIIDAIKGCRCKRMDDRVQHPISAKYVPEFPGHTVFLDIFYPRGKDRKYPCLMVTDALTRFCHGKFMRELHHENVIHILITSWIQWIGIPRKIITDAGSNFQGSMWNKFSSVYGTVIIHAPIKGHYQVGMAERHIAIIKKSFEAIQTHLQDSVDIHMKLSLAIMAHNATPTSGVNIAPITALTGRVQILDDLQWSPITKADAYDSTTGNLWKRLEAVKAAQAAIMAFDAQRSLDLCLRRNRRTGETELLQEDDRVVIYLPDKKKWVGTYRVLYDTGRNVIVEGNNKAFKHAKPWVRLRERKEDLSSPLEEMPTDKPLNPRDKIPTSSISRKETARASTDQMDEQSVEEHEPSVAGDNNGRDISPSYGRTPVPFNFDDEIDITRRELSSDESTIERATDKESEVIDHVSSTMIYCHYPAQDKRINTKNKPTVHYSHVEQVGDIFSCDSSWLWNSFLQTVSWDVFFSRGDPSFGYTAHRFRDQCLRFPSIFVASMQENMDFLDCSSVDDDFEGVDLSRLPPKSYLMHEGALNAIRKEIWGLVSPPNLNGNLQEAPLRIVSVDDPKMARYPRYFATLVVRKKGTGIMKARLCLRGDRISIARSSFNSAPTADRTFIRILLSSASNHKLIVGSCDVTQAFLQSDWLEEGDQYLAIPPPCLIIDSLEWKGEISSVPSSHLARCKYAFHCRKPLYGSRCAPLRWFFTIASLFKKWKWRCHKCDMCIFSRREKTSSRIVAMAILHVDDILVAATREEIDRFKSMMQSFRHGGFSEVSLQESVIFCGMRISKLSDGGFSISQDQYRSNIPRYTRDDLAVPVLEFAQNSVKTDKKKVEKLQAKMRKLVGASLWLTQTRYDIHFLTLKLATLLIPASQDSAIMSIFVKTMVQLYKVIDSAGLIICYRPFPLVADRDGHRGQIICYSDAGYGTLYGSASIESFVLGWGHPIKRDGIIECAFHPLAWNARKIRRICRSSTIAEILALCSAADICIWYKSALHELYYGEFLYEPIGKCSDAQLISPFSIALSSIESNQPSSIYLGNRKQHQVHVHPADGRTFYLFPYSAGESGIGLPLADLKERFNTVFHADHKSIAKKVIHCLLLTDSANAFSSAHEYNSRATERTARLGLAYLRDILHLLCVSYLSAPFNISDIGTKYPHDRDILDKMNSANRVIIGFLSRKDLKSLVYLMRRSKDSSLAVSSASINS